MKQFLISASNWKVILPVLAVQFIFMLYLFPDYQARMSEAAGEGVSPLDTRFSYDAREVISFFDKLGPEGREIYATVAGKVDMLYPLVYASLFMLVMASLLKRTIKPGSNWIYLSLLPLVGMLFDYVENFNTLGLLRSYPDLEAGAVSFGQTVTQIKHVVGIASVVVVVVQAVRVALSKLSRS